MSAVRGLENNSNKKGEKVSQEARVTLGVCVLVSISESVIRSQLTKQIRRMCPDLEAYLQLIGYSKPVSVFHLNLPVSLPLTKY